MPTCSELIREELAETNPEPFDIDQAWVEQRIEEGDSLVVLNLPQERGYEAPLWVPMGGYNECPLPVYQSVIFRHFQQQYGANILAVTGDTWVLQASRRPQTAEEALQLAKEHFIFCQYVLGPADTRPLRRFFAETGCVVFLVGLGTDVLLAKLHVPKPRPKQSIVCA
ncbi:DUF4253 domain-containing protein [Brevibacillus agri]|uniref:DUF4253 domain-containing protein n=1 Tax=Brevibacillus agri TaxID=51101 RepID=UPI003D721BBD